MKSAYRLLLSTLLLLSALLPGAARAEEPMECTQGCYIVVCGDQMCSLWRCDAKGCRYLSNWPREWSDVQQALARQGKAPASPPPVAYAKVCPADRQCDLYEISLGQAVRIGSFDNPADLVRYRETLREAPAKAR